MQTFDFWRDLRDAAYELTFFALYGSPFMQRLGASHAWTRTTVDAAELAHLPEVEAILLGIDRGGFEVAVIRMLILMAQSRGAVRRDRLERSARVLSHDEPFASLGAEKRAALIREQSHRRGVRSDKRGRDAADCCCRRPRSASAPSRWWNMSRAPSTRWSRTPSRCCRECGRRSACRDSPRPRRTTRSKRRRPRPSRARALKARAQAWACAQSRRQAAPFRLCTDRLVNIEGAP